MHRAICLSLIWACLGICVSIASPWTWTWPAWEQTAIRIAAPGLTVILVCNNLIVSMRLVRQTGRVSSAFALTLAQFLLFTVLFFQINCHFGAAHYAWRRLPDWKDWLLFGAAHAARASDLPDLLELFGLHGLNLQLIRHTDALTGCVLIGFHAIMGIFLIGVIFQSRKAIPLHISVGAFVLLTGCWLEIGLDMQMLDADDVWKVPLDALIRVTIDFPDMMQIFHWQLYDAPRAIWATILIGAWRILLLLLLARPVGWVYQAISIRRLGFFLVTPEELERIAQDHPDPTIRANAEQRRKRIMEQPPFRQKTEAISSGIALIVVIVLAWLNGSPEKQWSGVARELGVAAVSDNEELAHKSIRVLQRMGPYAHAAVPILSQGIDKHTEGRQLALVDTLGFLGPRSISKLFLLADCEDSPLAIRAAQSLHRVGPAAAEKVVLLLDSSDASVQGEAERALAAFGEPSVEPLIRSLTPTATNLSARLATLERLDRYWYRRPSDNEFVEQLASAASSRDTLENPDSDHFKIAHALGLLKGIGPAARIALPTLAKLLRDERDWVRSESAEVLSNVHPLPKSVLPALMELAQESNDVARSRAANAIGNIGEEAAPAVPILFMHLDDLSPMVRKSAVSALGKIGPAAENALPQLLNLLHDPGPEDEVLVRMGMRVASDIPQAVVVAIGRIRPKDKHHVRQFVEFYFGVDWEDRDMVRAYGIALTSIGADAVGELIRYLKRNRARLALARIGGAAVPPLVRIVNEPSSIFYDNAVSTLSSFPNLTTVGQSKNFAPEMLSLLSHPHESVRVAAVTVLGKTRPLPVDAVAHLIPLLRDESLYVARVTVKALGEFGPSAKGAIPALEELRRREQQIHDQAREREISQPSTISEKESRRALGAMAMLNAIENALDRINDEVPPETSR